MSEQPTAGMGLRWLRAAVLGTAALGFAGIAHATSGGELPGPVALTTLAALTTTLLAGPLGRPASTTRVVALLVGGQTALHGVFTAMGGHGPSPSSQAADAAAGRVAVPGGTLADALGADRVAAQASAGPSPVQTWVHHLAQDLSTPANLRMALAHLAAAMLLGLWLAAGERLAWRLVALLMGPVAAVLSRVAATVLGGSAATTMRVDHRTGALLLPPATDPPRPALLLLARAVDRRGPPAFSA